jgi:hypothetical protein
MGSSGNTNTGLASNVGDNNKSITGDSGSFGSNSGRFADNTGSFRRNTADFRSNTTCFGVNTSRFSIGIGGHLQGVPECLQNDADIQKMLAQLNQERKRKVFLENEVREAEQTYIRQSMARGGGSGAA